MSSLHTATAFIASGSVQAFSINFFNTNDKPEDVQSIALAVASSARVSLFECQMIGNQNTVLIDGLLFAANSLVEGNLDMISGGGSAYFFRTQIAPNRDGICLTADRRGTRTKRGGYVLDQCTITHTDNSQMLSKVCLGRPANAYA